MASWDQRAPLLHSFWLPCSQAWNALKPAARDSVTESNGVCMREEEDDLWLAILPFWNPLCSLIAWVAVRLELEYPPKRHIEHILAPVKWEHKGVLKWEKRTQDKVIMGKNWNFVLHYVYFLVQCWCYLELLVSWAHNLFSMKVLIWLWLVNPNP